MKIRKWMKMFIVGMTSIWVVAAAAFAGLFSNGVEEILGQGNSQSMIANGIKNLSHGILHPFAAQYRQYAERQMRDIEPAVLQNRGAPPGSMTSRSLCQYSGILLHTDQQSVNQVLWGKANGGSG